MWLSVLVVLCSLVWVAVAQRRSRQWRLLQLFPGDYPLPLLGNVLQIGLDPNEICDKFLNLWYKYGMQNYRVALGTKNWVFLTNPDDVQIILSHQTEISKTDERNDAMMPLFGNSISSSEGERWHTVRKMVKNCLQHKKLDSINKYCDRLIEVLHEHEGKTLDMYRYLKPYFLDTICGAVMGVETNFTNKIDDPYITNGKNVVPILTHTYFNNWIVTPLHMLSEMHKKMVVAIQFIRTLSDQLIETKKSEIDENIELKKLFEPSKVSKNGVSGTKSEAFMIEQLLKFRSANGDPLPQEMINEEVSRICFTAHYAMALTMSHIMYFIAKYSEVQKKILEEQHLIFTCGDEHKKPSYDEITQMKYLDAVMKESIRLLPTITIIGRRLHEDLKLSDGRIVPGGASVMILNKTLHLNPEFFPEPHEFIPERFFGSNRAYTMVPFSAGPRSCAGTSLAWLSMKATLSRVVRSFEASPSGAEPRFVSRLTTESENGVQLFIKKRRYQIT